MADYPDSFKDYPESLSSVKAGTRKRMDVWSPRDALIDALRYMDSLEDGQKIDALVICFRLVEGDVTYTKFTQSADSLATTIGIMEIAKSRMLDND